MTTTLLRVEVRVRPGLADPRADTLRARAASIAPTLISARTARVYLIEGALSPADQSRVVSSLLADPVCEVATIGAAPAEDASVIEVHPLPGVMDPAAQSVRDAIRDLTGTDVRVATGTRYDLLGFTPADARRLAELTLANPVIHQITDAPYQPARLPAGTPAPFTPRTVALRGLDDDQLAALSRRAHLFLSVAEMRAIADHFDALGRDPTEIELETLAQTWSEHCVHKTLKSRVLYREAPTDDGPDAPASSAPSRRPRGGLEMSFEFTPAGRADESSADSEATSDDPDATLEDADDIAHQPAPLGAIDWSDRPGCVVGDDGSVTIDNLLKSTVAAATHELIADGLDWTLSVFTDNSGVVAYDDAHGVCIKVETHNRPSAIEPYGGAATGIGGCIRDIIGTGLGAKPIASTDVFCVAPPTLDPASLPPGTLHPRRILSEVVAGVRDYGNRMGIPTVAGAVHVDPRYVGNPMVFCGCVGLIPRTLVRGAPRAGDLIVALGGRTGRDGIHGATFSSAELEQTHASEFGHAVQIGNAIEEKRLLDAILRARGSPTSPLPPSGTPELCHSETPSLPHSGTASPRNSGTSPLFSALTDCGAGGFSSAIGEMGKDLGATVDLDAAPLKYDGLTFTEIWISEAQERMILSVPPENLDALRAICDEEHCELAVLGTFGTLERDLVLRFRGTEVGRLSMDFLHDGLPSPTRDAVWPPAPSTRPALRRTTPQPADALRALLAHPSIASKHWIIRQYDHEVQGNTVVKPLSGPGGRGPSDATVIEVVPGSNQGIALACGLQTGIGDHALAGDPYHMALAAIDECVRNLVCAGADPNRTAILDNFCWPSCDRPENMGALVRACLGCYDGAKAYRTPFVSGKDSLNNQLRYTDPATGEPRVIEIPYTLLISGLARVRNVSRCVTVDAKTPGNLLVLVGPRAGAMGGSHYQQVFGEASASPDESWRAIPTVDLAVGPKAARAVAQMITDGLVRSAHDVSDGGLLTCVAEMLIATTGSRPDAPPAEGAGELAALLAAAGTALAPLGAELTLTDDILEPEQLAFSEGPSRYVLEIRPEDLPRVKTILRDFGGVPMQPIGTLTASGRLAWKALDINAKVDDLAQTWRAPLDW
ncbi:MAG: AIR synthase-related protein [Planctomycetota bacterium]|nr:AIR synthase-related protein [Planctomycetota bacterium]